MSDDSVPVLFTAQHIELECCAALSHTPALLEQLFIYRVALNAAISSELPHARSLTHARIPELFKRCCPSANVLKFSLPAHITTKFILHEIISYEIFSTRIFSNLRY